MFCKLRCVRTLCGWDSTKTKCVPETNKDADKQCTVIGWIIILIIVTISLSTYCTCPTAATSMRKINFFYKNKNNSQ